jgi:hypothetical protein
MDRHIGPYAGHEVAVKQIAPLEFGDLTLHRPYLDLQSERRKLPFKPKSPRTNLERLNLCYVLYSTFLTNANIHFVQCF